VSSIVCLFIIITVIDLRRYADNLSHKSCAITICQSNGNLPSPLASIKLHCFATEAQNT